ncbi:MAG: class I SAM-dependent methyltransferase [Chloroflexota bacterium]|nr:class I SAM-dependent methyltransferase [Chloroflexota bacterium]
MNAFLDSLVHSLLHLFPAELRRRLSFQWRYFRGQTPWDTRETPPEVKEFVRTTAPGRALDLGCGTGTNVLYLTRHGWDAIGVDYVERAIEQARKKAVASEVGVRFYHGDVTRLDELPIEGPFDYLLDIGCLHSLTPEGRTRYAEHLAHLAAPGAYYMLYAGLPRNHSTGSIGISPEQVATLFAPHFTLEQQEIGEDTAGGWAHAWYWLRRASPAG